MPGLWFDELYLGQTFQHAIRRTVTETDNVLFSAMTHNPAQLTSTRSTCEAPNMVNAWSIRRLRWG
jgi:acyl dehydratase